MRENVSFFECEGWVLTDNYAEIVVNVVVDEWSILLVRGDKVNKDRSKYQQTIISKEVCNERICK